MQRLDFDHLVVTLDDDDEAYAFADYLSVHGVLSVAEHNEVTSTITSVDEYLSLQQLKYCWQKFYENTPKGLLGLPIYVKNGCERHNG